MNFIIFTKCEKPCSRQCSHLHFSITIYESVSYHFFVSPPLASVALVLLKWTTIILEKSSHKEISELPNYTDFLESQWLLVSRICSPREKKLTNKAYRLLRRIWRKVSKLESSFSEKTNFLLKV